MHVAMHINFGRSRWATAALTGVAVPSGDVRESPPPAQAPRSPWPDVEMARSRGSGGEIASNVKVISY